MPTKPFVQSSSLIKKLHLTILTISIFFPLSFLAIFFSSQNFLSGLKEINHANTAMNLISKINESLLSSEQSISKLYQDSNTDTSNVHFTFNVNSTYAKKFLEIFRHEISNFPNYETNLNKINDNLNLYEEEVNKLIPKISLIPTPRSENQKLEIKDEILVAHQFSIDTSDLIRKEQIALKSYSDAIFNNVYKNRYIPLLVTTSLAVLFLSFILIVGFSVTRKFSQSLINLNNATALIAQGKLNFQAKIIYQDELGSLTHAFNQMINALKESRNTLLRTFDHISRLQYITASFSEAISSEQIMNIIVEQGVEALGANTGIVALITTDGNNLEIKKIKGIPRIIPNSLKTLPINYDHPLNRAVNLRKPIYINSLEQLQKEYLSLEEITPGIFNSYHQISAAILPLTIGTITLGGIIFSFTNDKIFDQYEKEFMVVLSQQCAQALHRAQLYESAKEAIAVRDEFLSIASHELKTPLTSLKLHMQRFGRQVEKATIQTLSLDDLSKTSKAANLQINRLTAQIEDLLDVTRISSGKFSLHFDHYNLAELIQDVIFEYGQQFSNIQKLTTLELDPNIIIKLDKIRIEQVLINLLSNAAKYAPNSQIYITLTKSNDHVRLSIKDNGPGISLQDQPRIFDRFERIKSTSSVGGLGLGLYITRQIILAHKGTIEIVSEPGNGAEFIIKLPLAK